MIARSLTLIRSGTQCFGFDVVTRFSARPAGRTIFPGGGVGGGSKRWMLERYAETLGDERISVATETCAYEIRLSSSVELRVSYNRPCCVQRVPKVRQSISTIILPKLRSILVCSRQCTNKIATIYAVAKHLPVSN